MAKVEKFATWRLRSALTDLAEDQASFLSTAEGAAFLEQLDAFFSSTIIAKACSWGYYMERGDVVNMIIERLLTTLQEQPAKAPIRFAASAEDPWGYLWTCSLRWAGDEWGTRGEGLEFAETLPARESSEYDSGLTPISDVIRLTFEELAPRTPQQNHVAILDLLGWLAVNPPQRLSYERDDRIAAHRHCPSLTIGQVIAVMKIARGSRPREAETSLMGQFLLDPNFDPVKSFTHIRALLTFKEAFRAAETGSRMLSDWIH